MFVGFDVAIVRDRVGDTVFSGALRRREGLVIERR